MQCKGRRGLAESAEVPKLRDWIIELKRHRTETLGSCNVGIYAPTGDSKPKPWPA